jgi:catechol 2,3-dioxygenase-like lactoylglutathione lyase family enzyme
MLDHIGIPVSDLTVSRTFYARALRRWAPVW